MNGNISTPFIGKEGKLDNDMDGQENKKEILNEEENNEQKQTKGNSKSESKLQITGGLEEQIADQEENGQEQEEVIDQEQQGRIGQEQGEETGEEQEERTDQEQMKGTSQEQEGGVDQEVKKDIQEEIDDENAPEYVEPPPPDPAAPLNLTDSQERLKPRFELKPEQLAEIEQLWDLYQEYTPAYTDINGYITEAELVYMLKCLLLMTYTPEQLQELIAFCVRPPHPQGHITFDQFVKIATIRQRDFPVEEELRAALQVLDTGKEGMINREYLMEVLSKQGHRMPNKQLNNLIKEVDIRNDGTIGIEDVVGTMCIDLTSDDMFKPKEEDAEENPEA